MNQFEIEQLKAALKKLLSQCQDKKLPYACKDIERVLNDIHWMEEKGEFSNSNFRSTEQI